MGKSILKSKTFWFNAITTAVGVATYLAGSDLVADYPAVVSILGTIIGVGNILLRIITKEPIAGTN